MKNRILQNHIQFKKKHIPEFVHNFNFSPIGWDDITIPEIIWIGFIHKLLGQKIGLEFIVEICKNINIDRTKYPMHSFAMISNYDLLDEKDKELTFNNLSRNGLINSIEKSISPFLKVFPKCPLNFLVAKPSFSNGEQNFIIELKEILNEYSDRHSKTSVFSAANVIYNQFVNGNLKVSKESSLSEFPEIEHYPHTEKSKRIASAIRASMKIIHRPELFNSNSNWSNYFWQTSYNIEPCKI